MMRNSLVPLAGLVGILALGGAACDDSGGSGTSEDLSIGVPHNFDQINSIILQPLCGNFSTCHSQDGKNDAGHLDLVDDPYDSLVGVIADNQQAAAEGLVRVKPCDPDNSFMWKKLNLPEVQDLASASNMIVGYGASMPKDNPHLPPELLNAIHDWIARGAHQFEPDDVTGAVCTTDDASVPDFATAHD